MLLLLLLLLGLTEPCSSCCGHSWQAVLEAPNPLPCSGLHG